jgi:hypothetical protein
VASPIARWLANALILAAALSLVLLGLAINIQLSDTRKLIAEGQQVEGTVTELVAARRSTAYSYGYAYSVGPHRFTQEKRSVPYARRDELRAGTKIRVWHDRADPKRATTEAELAEQESWGNRFVFPLIGVVLLAWGVRRIFTSR